MLNGGLAVKMLDVTMANSGYLWHNLINLSH